MIKEGDICPFCKKGKLRLCRGYFPYCEDHLICPLCDSTYNLGEEITNQGGKR